MRRDRLVMLMETRLLGACIFCEVRIWPAWTGRPKRVCDGPACRLEYRRLYKKSPKAELPRQQVRP